MKAARYLTNAFPLWVAAASLWALFQPQVFTWFAGPLIPLGLGVIMLGMGVTLTVDDFKNIIRFPKPVFCGVILQYTIMPFLGWSLGFLCRLPPAFSAGLILVACCPGGTASNVVTYLARANLPLSVAMTALSTLLAVGMTPFLTAWLIGSRVEVHPIGLLISTFQVVVLPVTAGVLMNRYFPKVTQKILPVAPLAAVFFITLIVASIVGAGREEILKHGGTLITAVFLLHTAGFLLGYGFSRAFFKEEITSRTISIEVGMQNSGLGVVLARANFANPLVAIPSAISSVFHSIIGSFLAGLWRLRSRGLSRTPNFLETAER